MTAILPLAFFTVLGLGGYYTYSRLTKKDKKINKEEVKEEVELEISREDKFFELNKSIILSPEVSVVSVNLLNDTIDKILYVFSRDNYTQISNERRFNFEKICDIELHKFCSDFISLTSQERTLRSGMFENQMENINKYVTVIYNVLVENSVEDFNLTSDFIDIKIN